MDLLQNLELGFSVALTLKNILYCFAGTVIGTLVGVLPGIGTPTAVALLLPFTYGLEPATALIMLAGIYYGAQYGCSIDLILINIPESPAGWSPCLMATRWPVRAGQAKRSWWRPGSFFAGSVATVLIAAFGPPLANGGPQIRPGGVLLAHGAWAHCRHRARPRLRHQGHRHGDP